MILFQNFLNAASALNSQFNANNNSSNQNNNNNAADNNNNQAGQIAAGLIGNLLSGSGSNNNNSNNNSNNNNTQTQNNEQTGKFLLQFFQKIFSGNTTLVVMACPKNNKITIICGKH